MNSTTLLHKEPAPCLVHSFCTIQGLYILKNDYPKLGNSLLKHFNILDKGNIWCDEGFKNIHHFYNPKTGKGIIGLTAADSQLLMYLEKAKFSFNRSALEETLFYVGAALHIIQDLCVPHHALGYLLKGHTEYENWVIENYSSFSTLDEGIYSFNTPMEVLNYNSLTSLDYSEIVYNTCYGNNIEATKTLLSLAQRTSAGFLDLVFNKILCFTPLFSS